MGGGGGSQPSRASEQQLAAGASALSNVKDPSISDLTVKLQRSVFLGNMTAINARLILAKKSKALGIMTDPRLEEHQFEALGQLGKMAKASGLSATDKDRLFDIGEQEQAVQKTALQDIERTAAGAGTTGSGLEQQDMAEALYAPGQDARLDVASGASRRRLEAAGDAGAFAGRLREQRFKEKAGVAEAQDLINRFNTEASNVQRLGNVQDARTVALRNAQERQRISNLNTDIANQEELARSGAHQQAYNNRLNRASEISKLYTQGGLQAASAASQQPDPRSTALAALGTGASLLGEFGPKAWDYWKQKA